MSVEEQRAYAEAEAEVALGVSVEQFLAGPVGRYIVQRAEEQRAAAIAELLEVDPEDAKTIRAIHHRIRVVDSIQQWLADAWSQARAALARLERMDADREDDMEP